MEKNVSFNYLVVTLLRGSKFEIIVQLGEAIDLLKEDVVSRCCDCRRVATGAIAIPLEITLWKSRSHNIHQRV